LVSRVRTAVLCDAGQQGHPHHRGNAVMTKHLVTRLREYYADTVEDEGLESVSDTLMREAVDEIERLHKALEEYGQHQSKACLELPATEKSFCYCGLTAELEGFPPGERCIDSLMINGAMWRCSKPCGHEYHKHEKQPSVEPDSGNGT
jgi:hypothetical protein